MQLAQRRLDSGDFAAAVRDAESALKLDPANADAKAVLEEASGRVERAERAAAALREAQARGGDVAAAAFELMKVDPTNAEAEKAAQASGAAFRPRAEEARRDAAEARTAADGAGAASLPGFADAERARAPGSAGAPVRPARGRRPPLPRGAHPLRAGRARRPPVAPPQPRGAPGARSW